MRHRGNGSARHEGRWRALREDVAFHFERFLARGAYSKVAVLWAILLLLSLVGGALAWLTAAGRFDGLDEAIWWAFLRLSDPGHLAQDHAPGMRLLGIVIAVLGLVLFVGALVAVLPIPAMASLTPQLLRYKVPLLIEKPLGRNLQEARAICDAVNKAEAADRVMVSLNRRFVPGLGLALDWARQQRPFRHVSGSMMRSRRTEPDFIWASGIHLIDTLWHVAALLR